MAAIFIQNIPLRLNQAEVVRAITAALHSPPLRPSENQPPMNFNVFLFRARGGRRRRARHNGKGILTLPTVEIGRVFLQNYGGQMALRKIRTDVNAQNFFQFEQARQPPKDDVVEFINKSPYIDPAVQHAYYIQEEQMNDVVKLSNIQMGWQCRDEVFSVEWDARADDLLPSDSVGRLSFEAESNELWITFGGTELMPFLTNDPEHVIISKFSRVETVCIDGEHTAQPSIIFTFDAPPALELHQTVLNPLAALLGKEEVQRFRLSSFSPSHASLAPYIGLALRVQCASVQDLDIFRRVSRRNLPDPSQSVDSVESRSIFAREPLELVAAWLRVLPWGVAFQLQAALNRHLLEPSELLGMRRDISFLLQEHDEAIAGKILGLFATQLKYLVGENSGENGPTSVRACLDKAKEIGKQIYTVDPHQPTNLASFNCYHASVTPTRVLLDGPIVDQTNRILRQYYDNRECFLRVDFVDEELLPYRWDKEVQGPEFVKRRVGKILKEGLVVAGRKFDFLAWSSSALKEHAVWFCQPFEDSNGHAVNAQGIRDGLGNFSKLLRKPARLGARMSQAFTATEPSIKLPVEEIFPGPDIERNGSCFTDGVGDISKALAKKISKVLQSRRGTKKRFFIQPSAYQFRMGGYKGVLAVNYRLQDQDIVMRPSQDKFSSNESELEIEIAQAFYRAKPFFLNRALVMILETLGVTDRVFLDLQDKAVKEVNDSTTTFKGCSKFLDDWGCGTSFRLSSVLLNLHKHDVDWYDQNPKFAFDDPFLERAIHFAKNHALRVMKHKARIPVEGSYTLVGVADVHGYLEENQVFVCIRRSKEERPFCVRGRILITRSPQVHPGDVQYVEAIGRPPAGSPFEQEPLINCVVFSTQGTRAVPSMLGGGDLDGDEYNVVLDPRLFPPQCDAPAEYAPATVKELDHDCTVSDLADWVVDYINNDILGLIADQHLLIADQSPLMCRDPACIKLAELASKAVDFAKSGTPVDRNELPRTKWPRNTKPDWAAGELGHSNKTLEIYPSKRIIGKLFRRIDLGDADRIARREAREQHGRGNNDDEDNLTGLVNAVHALDLGDGDDAILSTIIGIVEDKIGDVDVPEAVLSIASTLLLAYSTELRAICADCSLGRKPLTEEEALVGTIATKTSQPTKRKNRMSELRAQTGFLVTNYRAELKGNDEDEDHYAWMVRSWAAWLVARTADDAFGAKSFGIVALGSLFDCVKGMEDAEKQAERTFGRR